MSQDDHLVVDYVTVPGQTYCLVSFVSPDGAQKNSQMGMKIRGCFPTKDEADQHAKVLQKTDPSVDIFLVDMYKWVLIPPDRNNIEDEHYQEEFLQNMMKQYKENQANAKQMFDDRVQFLKSGGTIDDYENSKFYTKPTPQQESHPSVFIEQVKQDFPDLTEKEIAEKAQELANEHNKKVREMDKIEQ